MIDTYSYLPKSLGELELMEANGSAAGRGQKRLFSPKLKRAG
jgi:hypothetical protein